MAHEEAARQLAEFRLLIDSIDREILKLLNDRTSVVEQIGRVKREAQMAIYEPKREDEVFRNVTENNAGPMPSDSVRRVFERIVDEMRTLQRNRMVEQRQAESKPAKES